MNDLMDASGPFSPIQTSRLPQHDLDGLGKTFPRPTRDDFSSTGGSYIKLGNYKSIAAGPHMRAYDASFLCHSPIKQNDLHLQSTSAPNWSGRLVLPSEANSEYTYTGGLHTTKFHTGFQRKGERNISNPAADEVRAIKEQMQVHKDNMNANRADTLYCTTNRNGYNVITGESKPGLTPVAEAKGGKRSIRPTVSDVIAANSRITLRESPGRFYMPHASGVKHEYRQKVLCEAGVTQPQYSYVLQPGKAENLSAGVEDNFSRSQYPSSQPTDPGYKRLDLPDMCAPGKYTPRKQPGHPSANPKLVKNWGSGLDINNKALRGMV
jgi:hypothetical protein